MMRKHKKNNAVVTAILNHINNNLKEYIIVVLIFVIGIVLGVIFINNSSESQINEISNYINSFINSLKDTNTTVDKSALLKDSITQNIILCLLLWFMGSTVVGMPIVYAIIGYRGFCLSYTISSAIATLGINKGLIFVLSSLLLQNIIFIPAIFALAVSGKRLYKSIMKDKRKENIKLEICRHTILSLFFAIFLVISSLIEVYCSTDILCNLINYI